MLRNYVVRLGGRLIIVHQSSRCDMYTIEEVYIYFPIHPIPGWTEIKSWGRKKVGAAKTKASYRIILRYLDQL